MLHENVKTGAVFSHFAKATKTQHKMQRNEICPESDQSCWQ